MIFGRNQKGKLWKTNKHTNHNRWDNEDWFKGQRDTVVLDTSSASIALIKNSTIFMYCNKNE